ncbi:MAG: hypothetical protein VKN33_03880 [Candidatus Sericytochromatia bacterium]|nr:hypothetical protein [Candidatus Sericytochromatia bacterium]
MTDSIRPGDSFVRGTSSKAPVGPPAPASKPSPKFSDDTFFRSPPTPAQLDELHRSIAALGDLPPVPRGVLEKRNWVAQAEPIVKKARTASTALGNAAFFHELIPQGVADAAGAKVSEVEKRLLRAAEESGLRKPVPPADPNRPRMSLSKANENLLSHPIGAPLGVLLAFPALLLDGADGLSRPSERARYPEALNEYKKRLAESEKALKDYPLD